MSCSCTERKGGGARAVVHKCLRAVPVPAAVPAATAAAAPAPAVRVKTPAVQIGYVYVIWSRPPARLKPEDHPKPGEVWFKVGLSRSSNLLKRFHTFTSSWQRLGMHPLAGTAPLPTGTTTERKTGVIDGRLRAAHAEMKAVYVAAQAAEGAPPNAGLFDALPGLVCLTHCSAGLAATETLIRDILTLPGSTAPTKLLQQVHADLCKEEDKKRKHDAGPTEWRIGSMTTLEAVRRAFLMAPTRRPVAAGATAETIENAAFMLTVDAIRACVAPAAAAPAPV